MMQPQRRTWSKYPKYFEVYGASLFGDMTALTAKRTTRKLKHLMLGKLLWNSFISKFQLKMLMDKEKFKRGNDYDGDELESASLDDFNQDIKKFNTWFTNTRSKIVKEVGQDGYVEYLGCLFKSYKTAKD
eukprot:2328893-Ditylum_brightwellii.AAC.1